MKRHAKIILIRNCELGEFVRSQRKANGLRQVTLAKLMGTSQSKLSKIEKGDLKIGIEEWFNFCDICQVPVEHYRNFILFD